MNTIKPTPETFNYFWSELKKRLSEVKVNDINLIDKFGITLDHENQTIYLSYDDISMVKYTAGEHSVFVDTYGYSNTNIRTDKYIILSEELNDKNKEDINKLVSDIVLLSMTILYYNENNISLGELEVSETDYSFDSGH